MTKKKSSDPAPNLKAVQNLLSGCLVTVSLSQPVTETPQETPKVTSTQSSDVFDLGWDSQHSHHDEFMSWLNKFKQLEKGSVKVVDTSATLTANSDDLQWKSDTW